MKEVPEEYLEPCFYPLSENETVLGKVDPQLQKMYAVCRQLNIVIEELKQNLSFISEDDHRHKALNTEKNWLEAQMNVIMDLFWVSLREHFDLPYAKGKIGIRDNWQAVTY